MNEYNFNVEEIRENNMTPVPTEQPTKKKKHTALKITASLMAMAVVSAGSIGVYRLFDKPEQPIIAAETAVENAEKVLIPDKMSAIDTASIGGSALTTEEIVEKVIPSVVGIEASYKAAEKDSGMGGFFEYFYGGQMPQQQEPVGTGTGVIISEDGYIVTNAHVIYDSEHGYGKAVKVSVLLNDKSNLDAEIIGYDVDCDIAVLKVEAHGLTPASFGNSDELKLGESVTAIGNPLGFDLMNTVTQGIVSGLDRNITINDRSMHLLQTDAAINSGNSGGPLINKYGQVIGINSSKMSSSYGSASIEGIGFAIPSNEVSSIVEDLMDLGYVSGKPQLGISCQDVTETISQMYGMPVGIYVVEVTEGSAAERAGLHKGDIITSFNGENVSTVDELNAKKSKFKAGDEVTVGFTRNGEESEVSLVLDERVVEN